MAWAAIKQYVASKNVKRSLNKCIELIKEKVSLMGAQEWEKLCKKVKDIEEEYSKNDHVVDILTEQFIIRVDDSSEEDDADDDDDYDRSSPEPEPSTSKKPCTSFSQDSSAAPYGVLMEGIQMLSESEDDG
ncbi:hypothetical protein HF086_002960 [Spodoptera exigua]|uniref:Uncharacterized protein n=1 Tax=Spodoptera exigua TaxID=7107 RepID=A0A922SS43_SPOEX|nr:hypothetical protein HF086_002960 [Spodoptera exigua]